jgi:hypothetical protein
MEDFRIGDRVHVSNGDNTYSTYGDFFSENGFEYFKSDWAREKTTPTGDYTVVATGKHGDFRESPLYLLRGEDGKIYINGNEFGFLTLIEEGERKLKTWEMIKALTENPKLKFKSEDGHIASIFNTNLKLEYRDRGSAIVGDISLLTEDGFKADEWELVPQSVTFTKAVEAAIGGKKPTIVLNGDAYTLTAEKSMQSGRGYWLTITYYDDSVGLSTAMLDGMWTVEE